MAGLSVKGDPDGWLDAGRTISTLMTQLDSELADANRVGGAGLTSLWQGPAASAFATDWNARRSRYENLIDNARRVAQAITGYGEKLLGLVQTAANLESTWCSVGLHLLESGEGFVLPPGVESMPTGTQLSLKQALVQSEHDVKQLADDAAGAAEDLAVALGRRSHGPAGLRTHRSRRTPECRRPVRPISDVTEHSRRSWSWVRLLVVDDAGLARGRRQALRLATRP